MAPYYPPGVNPPSKPTGFTWPGGIQNPNYGNPSTGDMYQNSSGIQSPNVANPFSGQNFLEPFNMNSANKPQAYMFDHGLDPTGNPYKGGYSHQGVQSFSPSLGNDPTGAPYKGLGDFLGSDTFLNSILPVGANALAGWWGNNQVSDAANAAAQQQQQAANQTAEAAQGYYNQASQNFSPYMGLYGDTINALPDAATNIAPANLQTMQDTSVAPATLQDSVSFDFETDPVYQAQKEQMMRNMNRGLASSGQLNSSAADDTLMRNMGTLMGQSYDRSVADLNRGNQNELTRYGMATDQYGRDLQNLMMGNQNEMARYGMSTDEYGRLRDLAGMGINAGMGAAGSLANVGTNTVNALGQAYQYGGDAQAQSNLVGGLTDAQTAGMLGNIPFNIGSLQTLAGGGGLSSIFGGGGGAAAAGGAGTAGSAALGGGGAGVAGMTPSGAGLGGGAAAGAAPALNALAGGGTAAQAAGVGGAGAFNSATATGLGTSGLGMAAGALPFALMGGYILNKGMQQNSGPDLGINPIEYLNQASAGAKNYTNPETGQVFTITPESIEKVKNSLFMTHGAGGVKNPYHNPNYMT
jgi:hypothetical protein